MQSYTEESDAIISQDAIDKAFNKLELKFSGLKNDRKSRDEKLLKVLKGAADGVIIPENIQSLFSEVMAIEDVTYPSIVWESYVEKISLLSPDMVEIEARGKNTTEADLMVADIVAEFIKQKNQHEESNFIPALEAALWTATVMNLGIIHYCWHRQVNKKKQFRSNFDQVNNAYALEQIGETDELEYQGHKATFINPFDFYFDTAASRIDNLYKLGTFHQDIVSFDELVESPTYDPTAFYWNQKNVIWRDNTKLKELQSPKVTLTDDEKKQREILKMQTPTVERSVRLVTHYCDQIKIGDDLYKNVCVVYAKGDDNTKVIPLLVEYNPYPFNWKPYVYIVPRKIPNQIYSKSQAELAFNHFSLASFYQGVEMTVTGQAVFGTEFYPLLLEESVGESQEEFKKTLKTPGRRRAYDSTVYRGNGTDILSPQRDWALKVLPLVQQQKQQAKANQAEAQTDFEKIGGANTTATRDKLIANKRDQQQSKFEGEIERAIQRFIKLALNDMKTFFTDETITTDMSEEDLKAFLNDNVSPIKQASLANGIPVVTQFDPITKKKTAELRQFFLTDFEGEVKVTLKERSSAAALEEVGQMFDLAEKLKSPAIGGLAIQRYVQIKDMPEGQALLQTYQEEIAKQSEPDPNAQAAAQAQIITAQANAAQKEASAQHLAAQAAKTGQEVQANQAAMQLTGMG